MQAKGIQRLGQGIQIEWEDGHLSPYLSRDLRRLCPCAVCREIPGRSEQGLLPESAVPANVDIQAAHPVGWYALQFSFTDGHDTGIYSFEMLRKNCFCEECQKK